MRAVAQEGLALPVETVASAACQSWLTSEIPSVFVLPGF